jgi:DNA-binding NtrC family response regulator
MEGFMRPVLVTSARKDAFGPISSCLSKGNKIENASTKDIALNLLKKNRYDLIFIDLDILLKNISNENYREALQQIWNQYPSIEIIVMAQQVDLRKAVMAVKAGARNYLTYPIDPEEVKHVSERINESLILESELDYLRDKFWHVDSLELIQTDNDLMRDVFSKIRSVSPTRSTVLLLGETGTGKSMMAKLIHQHSNRKDAQFISIHCGAIPDTLLESELFGHEKGAFTGAVRRKLGRFEIAKGGTIFLDEIGTITPSAQIKLLQILQDGTFQRVGGEENLEADVRVIAASNTDLKQMCNEGTFRKDLYYRLNVFPIEIPPLRDRTEDIPSLSNTILKKLTQFSSKEINSIHPHVMDAFDTYDWPGNIRELENLLERAHILETSTTLSPEDFPNELFKSKATQVFIPTSNSLTLAGARQRGIEEIERNYLKDVLARKKGKISDSAKEAGISTRQLNKLMNKYGLRKEKFKLPERSNQNF